MFRYGRKSEYGARVKPDVGTKYYQHLFLGEYLPQHVNGSARVLEGGANTRFHELLGLQVAERWAADPYDGVAGGGINDLPSAPRASQAVVMNTLLVVAWRRPAVPGTHSRGSAQAILHS